MAMTLENTEENIEKLEDRGYTKSPVSKPNGMNKVIRYNIKRKYYWFSSNRYGYVQDTDICSSCSKQIKF